MPIGSAEIAQMNGAWQQVTAQRMQYGQLIGQGDVYGGFQSGGRGDAVMGGALNRMSAIGAPVAQGAFSMMQPGPALAGAWAGGSALLSGAGMGGAAMAGGMAALGAIPAMAAFGAAQYAGGQMMEGASQQHGLNSTLRSSYNFRNQQGGQGFNRSDMTSIGSMIRDMSGQFGPGGEVTGFRELTQLAGKMTTMGLAQGVKDVKDFAERFKHMVTSLKTMATDLGTTLEGAMEFAAAAKQSGVFGMKGATAFSAQARQTAVAGGLAMSEVTGAASIGSQIVRSIGGLGKQGAVAGMKTIGNIGTMMEMGLLSEEAIYNSTGLTGAEGRQAYATSQMEKTASFLQTGRGRRMIASMAGKDGTLDPTAVQTFLAGGMDMKETMRLDNKMKSTVGRANFIRNEGRLRGAVMEQFGGNAQAVQLVDWAHSKNINIEDMGDREMLFAQRQLGMGRDDIDNAIKQVKAMPRIAERQRQSAEDDKFQQGMGLQRKQSGIEGIKTRFDQAKEEVNNKLQKYGQDIMNSGSEFIDSFFMKLAGQYSQVVSEKADQVYRSTMFGGNAGHAEFKRYFGGAPAALGGGGFGGLGTKSLTERMSQGAREGGGVIEKVLYGESGFSKMKSAGYDVSGLSSSALNKRMGELSDMVNAVTNEAPPAEYIALGKQNAKWLNDVSASGMLGLKGTDRMDEFEKQLKAGGDSELYKKYMSLPSLAEKGRFIQGMDVGRGAVEAGQLSSNVALPETDVFSIGFAGSEADRRKAYAASLGATAGGKVGREAARTVRNPMTGELMTVGDKYSEEITSAVKFGSVGAIGMGNRLADEGFQMSAKKLFESDADTRAEGKRELQRHIESLGQDTTENATGEAAVDQSALALAEFQGLDHAGTDEDANKIFDKYRGLKKVGLDKGGAAGMEDIRRTLAGATSQMDQERMMSEARRRKAAGKADVRDMTRLGIATFEGGEVKLSGATLESIKGIKGGEDVLKAALGATAAEAGINLTDASTAWSGLDKSQQGQAAFHDQLAGLSVADKRALAAATGGNVGAQIGYSATTQAGLDKGLSKKGGGILGAAAGGLGVTLSAEEKKKYGLSKARSVDDAIGDKDTDAAAEFLGTRLGVEAGGSDALQNKMKNYLINLRTGNTGAAAEGLQGIMGDKEVREAQGKKKEEEDEAGNPLLAAIKKNTENGNKLLEIIAKHTYGTDAELKDLNSKTKAADPEYHGGSATLHNNPS